jgi:hypothetical protein
MQKNPNTVILLISFSGESAKKYERLRTLAQPTLVLEATVYIKQLLF